MGINNPIPRSLKSETKYVLYGFGWETFKKFSLNLFIIY